MLASLPSGSALLASISGAPQPLSVWFIDIFSPYTPHHKGNVVGFFYLLPNPVLSVIYLFGFISFLVHFVISFTQSPRLLK